MPSNSLPDADLNLPEMKTKSPSCPVGGVHMYEIVFKQNSSAPMLSMPRLESLSNGFKQNSSAPMLSLLRFESLE